MSITTGLGVLMAKGPVKLGGTSRIRFVMVEAEIADGNIEQITQAITNALRPATQTIVKRIPMAAPALGGSDQVEEEVFDDEDDKSETVDVNPAAPKVSRTRKAPKAPDIVEIDMNSDVSLQSFASGKDAGSQAKKYLIAAAWLKEHRNTDGVTAGHIYTCFRSMGWSANIPDFWQPLRDLKSKKFFSKNDEGEYQINHIGLDYVQKLGKNGAA